MSRSRLQRPFAHLALLAMLALSLLPSAGRIAAALDRDASADALDIAALCSPSGLGAASPAAKLAAQLQAARQPDRSAPSAPSPHDDDCAYCPLLGGLAPAVPTLVVASPILPAIAPPAITAVASPRGRLPGAPGARGPPLRT
jgi:hypothetical protein